MKAFLLGLILGAASAWCYFMTAGKQYVIKTTTVIETNWITQTETRYIDQVRYITQTNLVSVPISETQIIKGKTTKEHPYPDATISRVEPDGITYITDTGVVKISFSELSKDIQDKYGYTPEKAKQYQDKQKASQAEQSQKYQEWLKQKREKDLQAWRESQAYVKSVEEKKAADKVAADALAASNALQKAKEPDPPASKINIGSRKVIKFNR